MEKRPWKDSKEEASRDAGVTENVIDKMGAK